MTTTDRQHGWRLVGAWLLILAASYAALAAVLAVVLGALLIAGSAGLLALVVCGACVWWGCAAK